MQRFDPQLVASLAGLQLKARCVMEGFLSGIHGSPFHGPSVEFSEYREYQPGDDLRRVDWRLYARADRLYVKQYEAETNARCTVVCDTSASMAYRGARAWGSKLECARVAGAALGWLLLKQNDAVGALSLAGDRPRYLRPSRQASQLGMLLGHLDAFEAAGGPRLEALLEHAARILQRRSLVLFLSDLLEPSATLERAFRRLRFDGHEVVVVQVLDPDELDFPFPESAVLQDLETGERRQAPAGARERYLERFHAFMTSWRDLLRGLEIQHAVVRSDAGPGPALAGLLAARKRLR